MNTEAIAALEAERVLIGTVCLYPTLYVEACHLEASAFFGVPERAVWDAVRGIDRETAFAELTEADSYAQVWDRIVANGDAGKFPDGIVSVMGFSAKAAHGGVSRMADIVQERAERRRLLAVAREMLSRLEDPSEEIAPLISQARENLEHSIKARGELETFASFDTLGHEVDIARAKYHAGEQVDDGVPMFIRMVDENLFSGAAPGNTYLVAAPPGDGKSSFVRQWALTAARNGVASAMVSCEMGRTEVLRALYALATRINSAKLRKRNAHLISRDERARIELFRQELSKLDASVTDRAFSVGDIEAALTRWASKRRGQRRIAFVDYIQLVETTDLGSRASRAEHISTASRRLKQLSMRLDIPIVLVGQFNREGLNGKLSMHRLEGSSALEKDASAVLILKLERRDDGEPTGEARLDIVKQRDGATGGINLYWDPQTYMISDEPS